MLHVRTACTSEEMHVIVYIQRPGCAVRHRKSQSAAMQRMRVLSFPPSPSLSQILQHTGNTLRLLSPKDKVPEETEARPCGSTECPGTRSQKFASLRWVHACRARSAAHAVQLLNAHIACQKSVVCLTMNPPSHAAQGHCTPLHQSAGIPRCRPPQAGARALGRALSHPPRSMQRWLRPACVAAHVLAPTRCLQTLDQSSQRCRRCARPAAGQARLRQQAPQAQAPPQRHDP